MKKRIKKVASMRKVILGLSLIGILAISLPLAKAVSTQGPPQSCKTTCKMHRDQALDMAELNYEYCRNRDIDGILDCLETYNEAIREAIEIYDDCMLACKCAELNINE